MSIKVNVGDSHKWKNKHKLHDWKCIDWYHGADFKLDIRHKPKLPFADNSVQLLFCSHMIEHVNDDCDLHFFKEIHRVLKPGGVVRLVCPDYDKAITAYHNKDVNFFRKGGVLCIGNTIERLFVNYFASFRHRNYHGVRSYSGGPIINPNDAKAIIKTNNRDTIIKYCISHIPKDAYYKAHVNGFDFNKLRSMLKTAGFANIYKSDYKQSHVPEFLKNGFDNRPIVSLYVECQKRIPNHLFSGSYYSYDAHKNLHICPKTKHGHYNFIGDIEKFHQTTYRNINRVQRTGDFDNSGNITPSFHKNRNLICRNRTKTIQHLLHPTLTCIDIGGGAGTFANYIRDSVKSIDVLELDPKLADEAKRLQFTVHNNSLFAFNTTNKYDIVFAWHVLEHVDDILKFLSKCRNLSNKYIILEVPTDRHTPDQSSPPKAFDGHLHYFTVISLKRLATLCKLKILDISKNKAIQKPAILAIFQVN